MKLIETRILNWRDLRNLCVKHDWYTCGSNEEYSDILDFAASRKMTLDNLLHIAMDIIEHTNPDRFVDCEPNGTTPIQYVLFELSETCHSFFHDEKQDFVKGNFVFKEDYARREGADNVHHHI